MSETQTIEEIAQDIVERLTALDQKIPTDTAIETLVREQIVAVLGEDEAKDMIRKMRFGSSDAKLVGTKYARHNMTVGDVESLWLMQQALRGKSTVGDDKENGAHYTGPSEELDAAMKAASEGRYQDLAVSRNQDLAVIEELIRRGELTGGSVDRALAALDQVYGRAMDTAETGYGAELIGAQYASELWTGAAAAQRVFNLLTTFEMTAPTAYLPVEADIPEMLFVPEIAAHPGTEYATSKTGSNRVQVDAKKFVVHQVWSGEMEEDAIIPYIPFLRRQLTRSLAYYSDSLVLNGDTTNTATGNINLDDADPADTKHYLAFDGVRHAYIVDATGQSTPMANAALTLADLGAAKSLMVDATYLHDWGHPTNPADLVYVAEPATADQISFLDEVVTVDKFGPGATVLNGQQARVLGHPLISSIAMSKTEADGKVSDTGGNNTQGALAVFNRNGLVVGWRRRVQIETERLPGTDQTRLIASLRMGMGRFTPTGLAAGIKWAAGYVDIAL